MPLFMAKKQVYGWLQKGTKTIDVRKGKPRRGDIAVFQSGFKYLRLPILKLETGSLDEVIRKDNFAQVIPDAASLEEAKRYLRQLYSAYQGNFTAYYLGKPQENEFYP